MFNNIKVAHLLLNIKIASYIYSKLSTINQLRHQKYITLSVWNKTSKPQLFNSLNTPVLECTRLEYNETYSSKAYSTGAYIVQLINSISCQTY